MLGKLALCMGIRISSGVKYESIIKPKAEGEVGLRC